MTFQRWTVPPTRWSHPPHLTGCIGRRIEHLAAATTPANSRAAFDEPVWLAFEQSHLQLLDAATRMALPAVSDAEAAAASRDGALIGA
ncbi:MAG TPA: hypothetical protein VH482_32340 [Thermomicrobiales bacterium]|jgi:hypothetical protein